MYIGKRIKTFGKRINKKRLLWFVLFVWTIFIPICQIIAWIYYDMGRKSIQLVTIPVKSKKEVVNEGKENKHLEKFTINLKGD